MLNQWDNDRIIKALEEAAVERGEIRIGVSLRDLIADVLADSERVVRCKDCKYADRVGATELYCSFFDVLPNRWGYCAEGERIDTDQEGSEE